MAFGLESLTRDLKQLSAGQRADDGELFRSRTRLLRGFHGPGTDDHDDSAALVTIQVTVL